MLRRFVLAALALCCAAAALPSQSAVNLNTATRDELLTVPGIGPSKAQAIVEHRKTHGPFKSIDDLKQVKGFRDKLVERLRPELTVASVPAKGAGKADGAEPKAKTAAASASGRIDDRPRK